MKFTQVNDFWGLKIPLLVANTGSIQKFKCLCPHTFWNSPLFQFNPTLHWNSKGEGPNGHFHHKTNAMHQKTSNILFYLCSKFFEISHLSWVQQWYFTGPVDQLPTLSNGLTWQAFDWDPEIQISHHVTGLLHRVVVVTEFITREDKLQICMKHVLYFL